MAVLGANGAGKSTLFQMFNGLLQPTCGTVAIKGRVVEKAYLKEVRRMIGMVLAIGGVYVLYWSSRVADRGREKCGGSRWRRPAGRTASREQPTIRFDSFLLSRSYRAGPATRESLAKVLREMKYAVALQATASGRSGHVPASRRDRRIGPVGRFARSHLVDRRSELTFHNVGVRPRTQDEHRIPGW